MNSCKPIGSRFLSKLIKSVSLSVTFPLKLRSSNSYRASMTNWSSLTISIWPQPKKWRKIWPLRTRPTDTSKWKKRKKLIASRKNSRGSRRSQKKISSSSRTSWVSICVFSTKVYWQLKIRSIRTSNWTSNKVWYSPWGKKTKIWSKTSKKRLLKRMNSKRNVNAR